MLELGELLVWAARQDLQKRKPGRITFFAAIAEWKADPQSTFVSQLDGLSTSELLRLVLTADHGDSEASQRLALLLEDQLQTTNEENIDVTGLERLTDLVNGLCEARADGASLSPISPRLLKELMATTVAMQTAIAHREERVQSLTAAKQHLSLAISEVRRQTSR